VVRVLTERGVRVAALARSRSKTARRFAGLNVNVVEGDMTEVSKFKGALQGTEVLFHTAAYLRDNYKGSRHWGESPQGQCGGPPRAPSSHR
jgi:dihydroflavonol-4-reductase